MYLDVMPDVVGQWSSQVRTSNPIGISYEILWVSDKIRYDQSRIEGVIGLPSRQNRWGPTLKRYLEEGLSKVITTTAKPIGAHSTSRRFLRDVPNIVRNSHLYLYAHDMKASIPSHGHCFLLAALPSVKGFVVSNRVATLGGASGWKTDRTCY